MALSQSKADDIREACKAELDPILARFKDSLILHIKDKNGTSGDLGEASVLLVFSEWMIWLEKGGVQIQT